MKSKKSSILVSPSELHFVAAMSLDETLQHLGQLANPQIPITITEVTPDAYTFQVQYKREGRITAQVDGRLQRWYGTDTRVDVSGRVGSDRHGAWYTLLWGFMVLAGVLAFFFTSAGFEIVFMLLIVFGLSALFRIGTLSGVTMKGYNDNIYYFNKENESDRKRLANRRDTEHLLDYVLTVFKNTAEIELIDKNRNANDDLFKKRLTASYAARRNEQGQRRY